MSFTITPVNSMQAPVVHQGDDIQLNLSLTIPEAILVVFSQNMIRYHLEKGTKLIYLGTSDIFQEDFNTFVVTKFSAVNLSQEQKRLSPLIESLWTKTKATIENELRIKASEADIQNEAQLHQEAVGGLEFLRAQGIAGGRIFTEKQAKLIISIHPSKDE